MQIFTFVGFLWSCEHRAANHYTLFHNLSCPSGLYYAVMFLMKSLCQKMSMVIFMHVRPWGGRVSVSNLYFLVVLPQSIGFCILNEWASHFALFIFRRLIHHFLVRHMLAKCSFRSSVHSLWSFGSRRLTKIWARKKIQKFIPLTFREEYWTNINAL